MLSKTISNRLICWVRIRLESNSCKSCVQSADSNCDPLSVVMVDGMPNLAIHPLTTA